MTASIPSDRAVQRQIVVLESCFQMMLKAVQNEWPLDVMLSEFFTHNRKLGSRDRRLLKETVYAYFRWKGWIDRIAPPTDTVQETLVLAGHLAFPELPPALAYMAGSINKSIEPLPATDVATVKTWLESIGETLLSATDLVPEWVPAALAQSVEAGLIESWQQRPPVWIRCLDKRIHSTRMAFEKKSFQATRHPSMDHALQIDRAFPETEMFKLSENGFFIQDLASQVVSDVCLQLKKRTWWDTCCGSGGKSFAIAARGRAKVFASDSRPKVTRALQDRRRLLGLMDIEVAVLDAAKEIPRERLFGGVLVDASCSGLGTWSRNPDLRWRTGDDKLSILRQDQDLILDNASKAVDLAGYLVYSVCTMTQQETEAATAHFLEQHPEFSLHEVANPLNPETSQSELWVHPSMGPCNGMYISVFKKHS